MTKNPYPEFLIDEATGKVPNILHQVWEEAQKAEKERVLANLSGFSIVKNEVEPITKTKIKVRHITIAEVNWQALKEE